MANSYSQVVANGSTTIFNFSFPYLDEEHVHVYVDGDEAVGFTFPSPSSVDLTGAGYVAADLTGLTILIQRQSSQDDRLVNYAIGRLRNEDLNLDSKQAFYMAQEALDASGLAVGAIVTTASDVDFTPAGTIASDNVQDAIEEVATDAAAALASHTHTAAQTSFSPSGTVGSTDVQAAIVEVANDAASALASHTHTAAATTFSPTGTISSTDTQAAVAEVSGDVTTLSGTVSSQASDISTLQATAIDLQDQIDALVLSSGSYTDENAQDAVGNALVDSDTVDFTYTDGSNQITADVKQQMSITSDSSGLKLSGDATSPGNDKVYGTSAAGTKGWLDRALSAQAGIARTLTASVSVPADNCVVVTRFFKLSTFDLSLADGADLQIL